MEGSSFGRAVVAACGVLLLAACGSAPLLEASVSPSPAASPRAPSPTARPSPPAPPSATGTIAPRREILIDLGQQHVWAYEGSKVIVSTDVTTGMPALPTPAGHFHIQAKYSPYRFVSPWGRGSPYYYDPLWSDYAMLFADGGYFIHDAWWQRNFGPGGNLKTGSHGCVNVPPAAMPALYAWARPGDDVIIVG